MNSRQHARSLTQSHIQDQAAARRAVLGLPPAPVGEAETALVRAVAKAMLDWAGLDERGAEAPGYQAVLVPNRVATELIGREFLAKLNASGLHLLRGDNATC